MKKHLERDPLPLLSGPYFLNFLIKVCCCTDFFTTIDIRNQKLQLRRMPQYFPHFGMKLSRACVKRTISATGVAENNNTLYGIILYVTFFASVLGEFLSREMDLLMMPSNCGNLMLVQWPLFLLTSKV